MLTYHIGHVKPVGNHAVFVGPTLLVGEGLDR